MTTSLKRGLLSLIALATGHTGVGDTEAMPLYELEPFVVVAPHTWSPQTKLPVESFTTAKPVDLAAIVSAQLPAAALTRKGPLAGDIVLRGFSRDNVVITVDDNSTFCACPNRMDPPAFHVSSQQIEGISVRTGPFSVDQGGSVGGTVAVRTTAPADTSFMRLYGYYGSFDYVAAGLTGGHAFSENLSAVGGLYHQRGGVYEDGDGVRFTELAGTNYQPQYYDNTAFEVYTAEVKASYLTPNNGTVTFNYAIQDAQDVLYPGLRMDAPADTMNRASIALRQPLQADFADDIQLSFAVSHVDHDMTDTFRTSLNNMGGVFAARGYFMRTQAESTFIGAQVELSKVMERNAYLRYGLDWKQRYWDANNIIGNQTNDMLPDTLNESAGLWGVYEQRREPWALEAGVRLDLSRSQAREDISFLQGVRNTGSNKQYDLLPSLYGLLSRDIDAQTQAYVGAGLATRIPDPQERYMNLNRPMANVDWVGNPDLNPVHNLELQTGMRWDNETLDAQVSLFHSWVFNHIYLASLNVAPGGATSYENIDARIYGFSGSAGWNITQGLRLEGGLAWQEGVKETRPVNATSNVLGEIPPLRGRLAALISYEQLSFKAEGQFQDRLSRIDPDIGESTIGGWAVLNLSASYGINESLSVSVGVDNVFDKQYAVANAFVRDPFNSGTIVNEPGRFLFIRLGAQF